MSCGIYKITNLINNKQYIGQSINIENRWVKEKYRAFEKDSSEYNRTLSKAFRDFGIENFSFEIIEECPKELLNEKEKYYIEKYDTYFNGYNETTGGTLNENNCIKISKEELLKIYDLLINSSLSQKEIALLFNVGQDTISNINQGKTRRLENYTFPLRNNKKAIFYCVDCGKIVSSSKAKRCEKCEKIRQRKAVRPSREDLKKMIRTESFTKIGLKFNVTDNSIKKWCIAYNLPSKKRDINEYSDEEWEKI